MAALIAEHRITILVVIVLIFYFLWMDVTLYYKIQSMPPNYPSPEPSITVNYNNEPTGRHLFSPFRGLSIKMMMMDQVNNYIFAPLAEVFEEVTHFSQHFYFITPNMISFIGIIFALIAAKLITYDSFNIHRLSVILLQFRTFFDAYDGIVARQRLGIKQPVSIHKTSGYVVDGLADTIGFAAFLAGCYIYLRRNVPKQRNHQYLPLQVQDGSTNTNKFPNSSYIITQYMPPQLVWTTRQVFFVILCFAMQLAICSLFWNRYIDSYHLLLETPTTSKSQAGLQNEVMRSSIMWVLMWFWRVSNAHAFMQMMLLAVFVNRMWDFLSWIQYIGFIEIFTLAFFTEIHLNDVESYLNRVA